MLCVEPVVHVILEDSVRRDIRLEVSATFGSFLALALRYFQFAVTIVF